MAVVLQLVAVLRPAGGHRERRLGEQPGIAAPAEIQWASGVAGAEVVTNMEPKLPLPLVGAGASSVASGNTSAPRRPLSHCRRPSRRSGRRPGCPRRRNPEDHSAADRDCRRPTRSDDQDQGGGSRQKPGHASSTPRRPARPAQTRGPCPLCQMGPEARPTSMQHSNPPQVSNKSITINNLMAASPRKALTG